jgi:hypothetical protein
MGEQPIDMTSEIPIIAYNRLRYISVGDTRKFGCAFCAAITRLQATPNGADRACPKFFRVYKMVRRKVDFAPEWRSVVVILNAIVEKLKRQSGGDFKGRHFEAWLIIQAVTWYLRYPLSYRDLESMFLERGFEVDHSTINRWVLAYAPLIEKRLRQFRQPHCGSIRVDETYVKIRGE